MSEKRARRKLSGILSADAVGFVRLIYNLGKSLRKWNFKPEI